MANNLLAVDGRLLKNKNAVKLKKCTVFGQCMNYIQFEARTCHLPLSAVEVTTCMKREPFVQQKNKQFKSEVLYRVKNIYYALILWKFFNMLS